MATPSIAALVEQRRRGPDAVLEHLEPEADWWRDRRYIEGELPSLRHVSP